MKQTRDELLKTLRVTLTEALEMLRAATRLKQRLPTTNKKTWLFNRMGKIDGINGTGYRLDIILYIPSIL